MRDNELASILDNQLNNSIGGTSTNDEADAADIMDYYTGEPYGDEVDGESKIITREVYETIQWRMPSLLRVFASGNKIVEFEASSEQDELFAEVEGEYLNHLFMKENDGFMILYDWFKDTLLSRNGYVKVWVEEEDQITTESYMGLNDYEFSQVMAQEGAEPVEHTEYEELHDVKLKITKIAKKIKCAVIPFEEMRIAKNTDKLRLNEAPFVAHVAPKTISDLIENGYDSDILKKLPSYTDKNGLLENARDDETEGEEIDDTMREVLIEECFTRVDYDGDGVAELRKITKSGATILDNEEIEFIPFAVLCSVPMPHKHIGMSDADAVMPIQRTNSQLMRGMLNNLYLVNNPQKEIVEGKVNVEDLLTSVPGGLIRTKAPGMIREITTSFTAGSSVPMLDIQDRMKEARTGISQKNMGLDSDVLKQATEGAFMGAVEMSNQQNEMIARIFAETGVKDLFLMLHKLAVTHIDRETRIKLRGQYIPVNPTQWKHRTGLTVSVGLGTGEKNRELQTLKAISDEQKAHLMSGSPLVTPKNLYNTYAKMIERADLKEPSLYWTDPDSPEAQQAMAMKAQQQGQQEDPLSKAEQVKGQYSLEREKMKLQFQAQDKERQRDFDAKLDMMQKRFDASLKQLEESQKAQAETQKIMADMQKHRETLISKEDIAALMAEVALIKEGMNIDIGKLGIGAGVQE